MRYKHLSRIVRGTIVSLALTAAMSVSAQMVNETRPYSGTTVNPCNGENVSFSGSIHYHEKTQIGNDGRIHFVAKHNISATGTGQSTGTRYNLSGTMITNSKFPSFPITFRQRNQFTSTSTAPSFRATSVFHVNGNGVQTNVSTESDCKG
jgi:hypothetical protein